MAQKKLPQVIGLEEFNLILEHTKKPEHKIAFKLGFFCGLRISEVLKLKPEDVDLNREMLFIQQAKGKKDRYVPIVKPIKPQLKYIPLKIKRRALQHAISIISQKAIGRSIHFHTLRHSCATYLLDKGFNIREIQQMIGHSRLDTTMIYTHVNPKNLKDKLQALWE